MASDNTIYKYKPCALSTIVTDEYVKLKINQVVYNMNNVVIKDILSSIYTVL